MGAKDSRNLRPLTYGNLGYSGRLGNQLWQIASTLGLARSKGMRPLFPKWKYEPYFSCPPVWFGLPGPRMAQSVSYVRHLDPLFRPYLQDLSLWGGNVAEEVRQAFFPSPEALEIVDEEWQGSFADLPRPICAVHVRRGDVLRNPDASINVLPASYYLDGIASVAPASVAVFSDDIPWCKENIPGADVYYVGISHPEAHTPDYDTAEVFDWVDLFLMSRCADRGSMVISNSSYSWWGAFLADDCQKVLYPSRWYGAEFAPRIDFKLMIPDDPRWVEVVVRDEEVKDQEVQY